MRKLTVEQRFGEFFGRRFGQMLGELLIELALKCLLGLTAVEVAPKLRLRLAELIESF